MEISRGWPRSAKRPSLAYADQSLPWLTVEERLDAVLGSLKTDTVSR
ncbi:MAG: hypothetical protein JW969_19525 [Spirochaetales bacterium]|nr:hypothetical protein [Spirochaetales bacterium]